MTLLTIDSLHLVESSVKNKNSDDGMKTWSTAIHILLPVAALAILWGRRGFFAKFFLQFDKNCVSVFCPSFSKRQRLLKWASGRLPHTWSSHTNIFLDGPAQFWRDGSLLCTLINSAIPGACSNPHRHWQQPPSHGQALAYKYLGVAPIFTDTELENVLTSKHERILLNYLLQIQQAISRISVQEFKFCSNYVARGMGLVAGEQGLKTTFYIYSNSSASEENYDIMVSIRGPYSTYCDITIPTRYLLKKHFPIQLAENKRLSYQSNAQKSFLRSLSVDFGSFIHVGQKQNIENEIPAKLITERERVKVIYIPKSSGIHEVSIITNGFHLKGSPFTVNISENTTHKVDSFDENEKSPHKRTLAKSIRRRVISKIIDFIDEKVTYDNLKSVPMCVKNIPRIKVTQTKDQDNIKCGASDEHNVNKTVENLNATAEKHLKLTINKDNCDEKMLKFETKSTPLTSFSTDNETAMDQNERATDFDQGSLDNYNKKPDIIAKEDINENKANSYNFDSNNNTHDISIVQSVYTSTPYHATLEPTDFSTTSPICRNHIEQEVNESINSYNESSEIPKENFKKKVLQKQSKIDIHDLLYKSEQLESERDTLDVEIPTQTLMHVQNNKKTHDISGLESTRYNSEVHTESPKGKMPTVYEEYHQTHENSEDQIFKNKSKLESNASTCYKLDKIKFPELNSMHILNYISSLKTNKSEDSLQISDVLPAAENEPNTQQQSLQHSNISIFNKEINIHQTTFKERLKYWESQTNLNINEERSKAKHRRSLPNLFSYSCTGLVFFPSIDDHLNDSHVHNIENFKRSNEMLEMGSLFRERQEYWKTLSSQNVSYSSLNSSIYHLENTFRNLSRNRITARRSLPNLFSKVQREEICNRINSLDFYNTPDALQYKIRFKECKEYWERLSTQNLNYEDYYGQLTDSYQKLNFDDDNFDSGFCSSLPNLFAQSCSQDISGLFTEDPDSLKFKIQYKERQEYWERLSSHAISNASLNEFSPFMDKKRTEIIHQNKTSKSDKNKATTNTKKYIKSSAKLSKPEIAADKHKQNITDIKEDSILQNDSYNKRFLSHSSLNTEKGAEENNLTDDLKSITDQRTKMKMQFFQARKFFRSLEGDIK